MHTKRIILTIAKCTKSFSESVLNPLLIIAMMQFLEVVLNPTTKVSFRELGKLLGGQLYIIIPVLNLYEARSSQVDILESCAQKGIWGRARRLCKCLRCLLCHKASRTMFAMYTISTICAMSHTMSRDVFNCDSGDLQFWHVPSARQHFVRS